MLVIPAYAGIQASPGDWIPAGAGMTFHVAIQRHKAKYKMHNTL